MAGKAPNFTMSTPWIKIEGMRIWLLEPYFTGSHQAWASGYARHSRHDVTLLTMAGRFWKWRMHGGALEMAAQARDRLVQEPPPDLLLVSDMLNVPAFLALVRPVLAATPVVYYAHENQLTYPLPPGEKRDLSYALINLQSMLAAQRVCFNSQFHLDSWFAALPGLLKHFPDYNHLPTIDALRARSQVLSLGLDLRALDQYATTAPAANDPPLILWNQRWEYDKNPDEFFAALYQVLDEGYDLRVALLGENFRQMPAEFEVARARLGQRVVQAGFVADRAEYGRWLWQADLVVSTAWHEFFGAAVVEALYCGCFPLLPRRLAYPEIVPAAAHASCLYDDFDGLVQRLRRLLAQPALLRDTAGLRAAAAGYDWAHQAPVYDQLLADLASSTTWRA